MARVVATAMLAGLVLWLGACAGTTVGGEDGDDAPSGGKPSMAPSKPAGSPAKQCEAYASAWCSRSFGCYVQVGRLAEKDKQYNIDMCKKLIVDKLPCSAVQAVGSSYSTCISQINAMSCSMWDVPKEKFGTVPTPNACDDALSF